MGFEFNDFIGEIDEDYFECEICHMVLENPTQLPCGDVFCRDCIKGYLSVYGRCPESDDCDPVKVRDLRPIDEDFQEYYDELEMKCDYRSEGCRTIVKMEHRQEHLSECTFNPYRNIIWDNEELNSGRNVPHPPEFQEHHNMIISADDPQILATENWNGRRRDDEPQSAFAQSSHCLAPGHSYFKIQILNVNERFNWISIGLNCMHPTNETGWRKGSIACNHLGELWFNQKRKRFGAMWKTGDIIKCGIIFSSDYKSNGGVVKVYFLVNQRMMCEKITKMPNGGFFPTISMSATGTKVKYLSN